MFAVQFFQQSDGSKPAEEFIHSIQDKKLRAKVFRDLRLLQEYGPELGEPYTKSLGGGLFELRTRQGSNVVRCIYFYFDGRIIVLTNGFIKRTQKTPISEILSAKRRKRAYEMRLINTVSE